MRARAKPLLSLSGPSPSLGPGRQINWRAFAKATADMPHGPRNNDPILIL